MWLCTCNDVSLKTFINWSPKVSTDTLSLSLKMTKGSFPCEYHSAFPLHYESSSLQKYTTSGMLASSERSNFVNSFLSAGYNWSWWNLDNIRSYMYRSSNRSSGLKFEVLQNAEMTTPRQEKTNRNNQKYLNSNLSVICCLDVSWKIHLTLTASLCYLLHLSFSNKWTNK